MDEHTPILWLDFETRSEADIKKTSAHHYSEQGDAILMGYAFDDEPAQVIDFLNGDTIPTRVREAMASQSSHWLAAFNIGFERNIIKHSSRFGFCFNDPRRWFDVQTRAYEAGLSPIKPLGALTLRALSVALGIKHIKQDPNDRLKNLFCKPNANAEFTSPQDAPHDWKEFKEYCKEDVEAMRELFYHPMLSTSQYPFWPTEKAVADVDQLINDRGIPIDIEFCYNAAVAAKNAKVHSDSVLHALTLGQVEKASQKVRLKEWINENFDLNLESVGALTINALEKETDNYLLKEICNIILDSGVADSKFLAALQASSSDHRIHGALFMCGAARTRRWGGRLIQPQNMRRPKEKDESKINAIRQAIASGATGFTLPQILDTVRSIIAAPPGKLLMSVDYSSIENRALMWLAGQKTMLDFFKRVDNGTAEADPYEFTYGSAFGCDPTKIDSQQRFIGKMMMLMFQYLGGVGGLIKGLKQNAVNIQPFCQGLIDTLPRVELAKGVQEYHYLHTKSAELFGLAPEQYGACAVLKNRWRAAHPEVVALGKGIQECFAEAIDSAPGTTITIVPGKLALTRNVNHICMQMYGGELSYPMPKGTSKSLTVEGIIQAAGQKYRLASIPYYSGKFLENAASGLSRNILAQALVDLENAGYHPIFHVHDEVVLEVDNTAKVDDVVAIMTRHRPELEGLPLAAEGWVGPVYRKG